MTNPSWFVEEDDTGLVRRSGWHLQLPAPWAEIETFFETMIRDHPGPKAELEERLVGIEVFLEQFWTELGAVRVEVDGVPYLKTKPSSRVSIGVSVKASRLLQEAREALAAGDTALGMLLALDLGSLCTQLEAKRRNGKAARTGRSSLKALEGGRERLRTKRLAGKAFQDRRNAMIEELFVEYKAKPGKTGIAKRIQDKIAPFCAEHKMPVPSEQRIRQLYKGQSR